jgi:putative hydrolase of the HAD superfamily
MRFIGHAFVDWDDTIAENIKYFNMAEEANAQLIARLTRTETQVVRSRGQEIDLAVARRVGLGKDSLGMAWCECYREFCGRAGIAPDAEAEAALWRASRMPYEVRQELLPGSAETLAWLHESGFEVTIWTAGDADVQSRKIADSGLEHLIHRRAIVPDKNPDRLLAAMQERDPACTFVVGNSIHSDIRPALAVGVLAVHIPAETWAYDHGRLDVADPNYQQINQIQELPPMLAGRFRMAV